MQDEIEGLKKASLTKHKSTLKNIENSQNLSIMKKERERKELCSEEKIKRVPDYY